MQLGRIGASRVIIICDVNSRTKHFAIALVLAVALVGIADLVGNEIERPVHDGKFYVDMARHGIVGNGQLAAPFAYRPAVPLAVRAFSQISGRDAIDGFRLFSRLAALTGLLFAFALARFVSGDVRVSTLVMATTALSYFHLKFPLFFFPLVDVEAAPLMLLALWAALTRHWISCLAIASLGLFFKEFLAVPLVVMMVVLARDFAADRSRRDLAIWIGVTMVVMSVCIALPRALLPVRASMQFLDPFHNPESLSLLWTAPLQPERLANLAFATLAYWLPTAMLATRERGLLVFERLGEWRLPLAVAFGLVVVLALYGGTNLNLFMSYTLAIQVIVLASLRRSEVRGVEWALVLVGLFVFNRIAVDIPSPIAGREALYRYVDFYGGWSDRTVTTAWRSLELGAIVLAANLLRLVAKRSR